MGAKERRRCVAELTREEAAMKKDDFYTLMTAYEEPSQQQPARKKRAPNKSYLARLAELAADSLPKRYPAANA